MIALRALVVLSVPAITLAHGGGEPDITLAPERVTAGREVTVTGDDFEPNEALHFDSISSPRPPGSSSLVRPPTVRVS